MNILITSGGRRVDIIREFKEAVGPKGRVYITDRVARSAGSFFADKTFITPRITDKNYIPELKKVVQRHKIDLLFSVIDTELPLLSEHREAFKKLGCFVMVSSPETIEIAREKNKTAAFFRSLGITTPRILTVQSAKKFPVFIKPAAGSGSQHAYKVESRKDLMALLTQVPNPLILEYIDGQEFSIDCLSDFDGNALAVVPRTRELTMGGYAVRSTIVLDRSLMRDATRIISALHIVGPAVLQCIKTKKGNYFFECNPRFGGGSLTGMRAVGSARAVVDMAQGKKPKLKKPRAYSMAAYLEHIFYDQSGRIRH